MKTMKVHSQCDCRHLNGWLKEIPMGFLNEEWAQNNHGQSLDRLNERGGLTVWEILAIAQRRPFQVMDHERSLVILIHMLRGYSIGINASP